MTIKLCDKRPAKLRAENMAAAAWLEKFKTFRDESFDRLVLSGCETTETGICSMTELPQFVVDRTFDAHRETVWKAWADPRLLVRWYGPGVETVIHKFELETGGIWLNEMKWDEKSDRSKMVFQEVAAYEKLVWRHHSTDADWNIVSNPMMPDWPRTLLTTVTFEDSGKTTAVRLVWTPHEATGVEIACFAGAMEKFGGGWSDGFKVIDGILAELRSG